MFFEEILERRDQEAKSLRLVSCATKNHSGKLPQPIATSLIICGGEKIV